jgi:hypothetical protein
MVLRKQRGRPKRGAQPFGKDPVMSLRIPQRIREEVDALANREGISRSLAIRKMIEQGLKKYRFVI